MYIASGDTYRMFPLPARYVFASFSPALVTSKDETVVKAYCRSGLLKYYTSGVTTQLALSRTHGTVMSVSWYVYTCSRVTR